MDFGLPVCRDGAESRNGIHTHRLCLGAFFLPLGRWCALLGSKMAPIAYLNRSRLPIVAHQQPSAYEKPNCG